MHRVLNAWVTKDLEITSFPFYFEIFSEDGRKTAARAFCECDLQFVQSVRGLIPTFTDYDTSLCVLQSPGNATPACCASPRTGLFTWFVDNHSLLNLLQYLLHSL